MTFALGLPLAAVELAEKFEWGRIQSNADWILPIGVLCLILIFVRAMYQRDAAELPAWLSWLLTLLRTATFLGLLFMYLQPQWRCSRKIIHNSRVLVAVDTSMSMARAGEEPFGPGGPSRLQQVAAALDQTDFLPRLRRDHDVLVYQFNNSLERDRVVFLEKIEPEGEKGTDDEPSAADQPGTGPERSRSKGPALAGPPASWRKFLEPRGTETRMGEAMEQMIREERRAPLAGMVVIGDGGQNAGLSPDVATEMARQSLVPLHIHTVIVGSQKRPATVRVYDFKVPPRAFPGDKYVVTGFVQGQGLAGRTVQVGLLSREGDAAKDPKQRGKGTPVESRPVTLGKDGDVVPVRFELSSEKTGRRTLCFRVQPPAGDTDTRGKYLEADVEVIDRKNNVLLIAGGPARDYQYLLTLLSRDHTTTVDVLLQTAQPGTLQQAHEVLEEFPPDRKKLFDYDCIVAFDADWRALTPADVDLLETWVGDQGGGLIVVAGPVHNGRAAESWVQDQSPEMKKIRNLYPVEFHHYLSTPRDTTYTAAELQPMHFTREGHEAEFLWLGETLKDSERSWVDPKLGIWAFCPVRDKKRAATVLATFPDPLAAQDGKEPVYMAEQFYGSGRVFYMGSPELWRLRRVDPAYFDQIYTKLIRHVSQGRLLLRQSSRGVLLVNQDHYLVGNSVEVRAQLTNAQLEPYVTPKDTPVLLQVTHNGDPAPTMVKLFPESRAGTFKGQFPVLKEGEYRLELPIPESKVDLLTRSVQVVMPKLEEENPQANADVLRKIAKDTGGTYYPDLMAAMRDSTPQSLVGKLESHNVPPDVVPMAPDPAWEETWLLWAMIALCGALCLEWLIRRLARLA